MLSTCSDRQRTSTGLTETSIRSLAILNYEQVSRLNGIMDEMAYIHGRGNFPTLEVRLCDLVAMVRKKLCAVDCPVNVSVEQSTTWWPVDDDTDNMSFQVQNVRMNGGAASYVLTTDTQPYNDLDLIFNFSLLDDKDFDRIKLIVLKTLVELLPEGVNRTRMTPSIIKEAYVSKMVKVNNDTDRWSLITLGTLPGQHNVELKFVDKMKRPFEFSVDSFQIVLDSLLLFNECTTRASVNKNFYPTVLAESVYGDFNEALYHLLNKLIVTRNPEEIRGGGLLKFCNLLLRNFTFNCDCKSIMQLKRYMCSRFFIDFSDIKQLRSRLVNYLANHFCAPQDKLLKYYYLKVLKQVIKESTVNFMVHEREQTLRVIAELLLLLKFERVMFQSSHQQL